MNTKHSAMYVNEHADRVGHQHTRQLALYCLHQVNDTELNIVLHGSMKDMNSLSKCLSIVMLLFHDTNGVLCTLLDNNMF